jgi:hypothetical protein
MGGEAVVGPVNVFVARYFDDATFLQLYASSSSTHTTLVKRLGPPSSVVHQVESVQYSGHGRTAVSRYDTTYYY